MARRAVPITDEQRRQVLAGAALGLSHADIALLVGLDRRTMERRCRAELERGRAEMRHRIHRVQWDLAARSPAMAIWLGKQYLGQRDVPIPTDQQGAIIEYVQRVIVSGDSTERST
jgi:hypothetical protein